VSVTTQPTGFFWVDGYSWMPELWLYCAIILDPHPGRGRSRVSEKFRGETPDELRDKLAAAGYEVSGDIKALCESAPQSPRIRRGGRKARVG
jgi:hypothetical protein